MRLSRENLCDFSTFRLFDYSRSDFPDFCLRLSSDFSGNKFHQVVEKFSEFTRVNFWILDLEVYN
nr:MAG TPA: hypothetical protein [Caudoviricetes sp.]